VARAPATPETEETEEDAPGAKTRAAGQDGETGPNAAKTRSREDAPKASAEETTRASAPMAHPTATSRRGKAASTEPKTPETRAELAADAGRAREPQKPTIPTTKTIPQGRCPTPGASSAPHSLAERAMGAKKRRQGGSARVGPGKFLRSKTRRAAIRPSFWVPLRGGLPVLDSCPFARLPSSLLKGHKGIGKNSASTLRQRLRSDGR
jgi:hypothetical protein